ncbi:MAG: glycosyltransferase [Patescibacteria group bacterium]
MISIIITTKEEEKTLPRAIKAILDEKIPNSELIVVDPSQETKKIISQFPFKIRFIQDKGIGKPAALNLVFQKVEGEILVLTDGDVFVEKGAIKKLLKHFIDKKIGAVSGHPVPINPRDNLFGYWSHFLTDAADYLRRKKTKKGEYLVCSGYLYAIRNVIKEIPEDTLVEDSIISEMIWQRGYKIIYEPEAKVYVKYPDNFSDWLKQKIRATGGYLQSISKQKMRGFLEEIKDGFKLFFTYPKNLKEFFWTILLYLARLYLWFLIFWQIKILKKFHWPRIESTK